MISGATLAADVCASLQERAKKLSIVLETSIDGAGEFEGDPQMIRSLLVNLIENSIDACRIDTQKKDHHVEVGFKESPDSVVFTISDNGIGMDQETREKVFSLFFSSKGAGGTGLGLFVANKIAQSHGGTIDVESEEGAGSRFRVELPRHRPQTVAPPGDTTQS
jgi:signal transduction histidine kinase